MNSTNELTNYSMSFYHMMNGVKPATFFILPMLGKHPDDYPRFRDCFLADEAHPEFDNHIHVYTRTGGGNREDYEKENQAIREMPGFVDDYDDDFDDTYASWVFEVPEQWMEDFEKIMLGRLMETSVAYQEQLRRVFPALTAQFDQVFSEDSENDHGE